MNIKQFAPAFQIYASDILGDTDLRLMSAEEIGCFFLLLLNLWVNGGTLPHNIAQLQQIMHLKSHKKTKTVLIRLQNQFDFQRKTLRSAYIDQQLQKQAAYRLKQEKSAHATNRKLHRGETVTVSFDERFPIPIPYSLSEINTTITEVVLLWNQFSSKKPNHAQLGALERFFKGPLSPLLRLKSEDLRAAVDNFRQARQVKNSRSFNWNIYNFFSRALDKYLPGAFDIDHYQPENFRKEKTHAAANPYQKPQPNPARPTAFIDPQSTVRPVET